MVPLARRILWKEKLRFFITSFIIGVLILLVQLLFNIYEGAKECALSYVSNCRADIWVCPKNETNILRSSSVMDGSLENKLRGLQGIDSISKIVKLISSSKIKGINETLIIFGFDTTSSLAEPPFIFRGKKSIKSGEIIIEKIIAKKHKLNIGDSIEISSKKFCISGISEFTNAVTIQFAFITINDAEKLLGVPSKVSFYLLRKSKNANTQSLVDSIKINNNVEAFEKPVFIQNNLSEVGKGILPILWTIAITGSIAGIIIITLMLQNSIMEKKEEYAIMKALGANKRFLVFLVMRVSISSALIGYILGTGLNIILSYILPEFVFELVIYSSYFVLELTLLSSVIISLLASWFSISKLFEIEPAEVFKP